MALALGPCGPLPMIYSPPETRGARATRTMTAHMIIAVAVLLNCAPPLVLSTWRKSWQTWRTRSSPPKVPQLSPSRGIPNYPNANHRYCIKSFAITGLAFLKSHSLQVRYQNVTYDTVDGKRRSLFRRGTTPLLYYMFNHTPPAQVRFSGRPMTSKRLLPGHQTHLVR